MLSKSDIGKLTLGTAQFGLDYGITNGHGKLDQFQVASILSKAQTFGISKIDTAPGYGNAEEKLGLFGVKDFGIYSKIPRITENASVGKILETIKSSIRKLDVGKLDGLLLHYPWDLLNNNSEILVSAIKEAYLLGLYKKLGISVYDPDEVKKFLEIINFDFIQAPVNIMDRRFCDLDFFNFIKINGLSLHARSIFLQGLLLDKKMSQKPNLHIKLRQALDEWHLWLEKHDINALDAALSFALQNTNLNNIIFGVSCQSDLEQILSAKLITIDFPIYNLEPQHVDPRKW